MAKAAFIDPRTETDIAPARTGAAAALAYLAAAPLLAAAVYLVAQDGALPGGAKIATGFMSLYGAALIVFLGGVRWGVAIMRPEGPTMKSLFGAVLPLFAALPLFLPAPPTLAFPAIMALFAIVLIDDLNATRRGSGAPHWYLAVRTPLTALIEISFLVAFVAIIG